MPIFIRNDHLDPAVELPSLGCFVAGNRKLNATSAYHKAAGVNSFFLQSVTHRAGTALREIQVVFHGSCTVGKAFDQRLALWVFGQERSNFFYGELCSRAEFTFVGVK